MDVIRRNILFITYDGLTDPLGQSQILPYIQGISSADNHFTILSFEKPDRYAKLRNEIETQCIKHDIDWHPLPFHSQIPIVSKIYDRWLLRKNALRLYAQKKFEIIHCRSYIAAELGLLLKQKFDTKFIFDMRGFWADEKKDGGAWPQHKWIYRQIYSFYKQKEKEYIAHANAIISLTDAAKKEIESWPSYKHTTPIYVIPCSVDTQLFKVRTGDEKNKAKQNLGLSNDTFVLSYLGALGSWYMLPEMLDLFSEIKMRYSNAQFLLVTHTPEEFVKKEIFARNLSLDCFIIKEASRQQVPLLLKASDINVSFIKPVYSKMSSSPTKLGEVLAMGIPVITNEGVGDVKEIVEKIGGGLILNFNSINWKEVVATIPQLLTFNENAISQKTNEILSLSLAIKKYLNVYKKI